jgi:hypothetical protein
MIKLERSLAKPHVKGEGTSMSTARAVIKNATAVL